MAAKETDNPQTPDEEIRKTNLLLYHADVNKVDDNSSNGNGSKHEIDGGKQENEETRLERIAQMFMARSSNSEDRHEENERIQKKDAEIRNRHKKKLDKKNKKKSKEKTEQSKRAVEECQEPNETNIIDSHDVSIESEADESITESEKSACCFGFLAAWLEKIRGKRAQKKLLKKKKKNKKRRKGLSVTFSDIVIEFQYLGAHDAAADDSTGSKFDQNAAETDGVEITVY